ncbi:hypothetical protein [Spiroplasma endosymbiont of Megaselia nigra]|uniref:hypothetical protein n=1 Tax=Spiroplasma endosymbiont of Megaselia nigra TaxID=2478537 RepID=UPI000F8830B7|nr:hypothetical protein [Spiroplasma endosymbiont of Megaselia nigra]RUO85847.1 hypothetical protein D9R21_06425 [Spiroplasma endosymbiont of Megaselia nigra]
MKKLLSLLSILTISETAVQSVIAASPYQKENNNNYQQINNLEILKRNKRKNYNKSVIIDSYVNEIQQNILVIDTNIEVNVHVDWTGGEKHNSISWEDNTKKYGINWEQLKNSESILLIGSFEWNNYAAPFKKSQMLLQKNFSSEEKIYFSASEKHTATSGWATQTGTISIQFNILKRDNNFVDLNLKVVAAADSYGAVHGNDTYSKINIIEIKK